jgi:hypothetical protein
VFGGLAAGVKVPVEACDVVGFRQQGTFGGAWRAGDPCADRHMTGVDTPAGQCTVEGEGPFAQGPRPPCIPTSQRRRCHALHRIKAQEASTERTIRHPRRRPARRNSTRPARSVCVLPVATVTRRHTVDRHHLNTNRRPSTGWTDMLAPHGSRCRGFLPSKHPAATGTSCWHWRAICGRGVCLVANLKRALKSSSNSP